MNDELKALAESLNPQAKADRVKGAINRGLQFDPDAYAKAVKLSARTGVDPTAVMRDQKTFEDSARAFQVDPGDLVNLSPKTAEWLVSGDHNSAVAHDDIQTLTAMEKVIKNAQEAASQLIQIPQRAMAGGFRGVGGLAQAGGQFAQEASQPDAGALKKIIGWGLLPGLMAYPQDRQRAIEVGRDVREYYAPLFNDRFQGDALGQFLTGSPTTPTGKGTQFVGNIAGTLGKAVLSGPAAPLVFGAEAAGNKAGEALDTGATGAQALVEGALSGNINAGMAFIPGGNATGTSLSRMLIGRTLRGVGLGLGSTAAENLITRIHREDTPLMHGWQENVASFIGLEYAGAIQHHAAFNQLAKAAESSKLRARSPEMFKDAVGQMLKDSKLEQVMIPADKLETFFQSQGIDPAKGAEDLGARNFLEAKSAGTDVIIPTADLLSKMDGKQIQELSQDFRVEFGGMTAREAEAYTQEAATVAKEGLKQQAPGATDGAKTQIHEDTRSQLIAAGFEPSTADTYAKLHSSVIANLAERSGLDPLALSQKYGLQVTRPVEGERRDMPLLDLVMARMEARKLAQGGDTEFSQGPVDAALKSRVNTEADASVADSKGTFGRYAADPETHGGKVVNGDIMARIASKGVEENPLQGHAAIAEHGGASRLANDYFEARMKEPAKSPDETVLILVGNAAVGKTKITANNAENFHTILDTNQADSMGLQQNINQALRSGRQVDVLFVHAPLEEAVRRNVSRQANEGRPVSIMDQADLATKTPASFAKAVEVFGADPAVTFNAIETTEAGKARGALTGQAALDFVEGLRTENASSSTITRATEAYNSLLGGPNGPTEAARAAFERGIEASVRTDLPSNGQADGPVLGRDRGVSSGGRQAPDSPGQPAEGVTSFDQPGPMDFGSKEWNDYYRNPLRGNRAKGDRANRANEALRKLSTTKGQQEELARREAQLRQEYAALQKDKADFEAWDKEVKSMIAGEIYPERDRRGFIQFGPDRKFQIGLLENSDLSTFVHESGHFYLEIMGDLAHMEGSSEQVKADYQKVLDYLGVDAREKIGEAQHEQWARSNEAYLMEGKTPSPELRGVFARVKSWMTMIYRQIQNIGVKLTPEVRGVFDRLYAADSHIEAAREALGDGPGLFASAKDMGVTEAEFAIYAKAKEREIQGAKDSLEAKLIREFQRERETAWKAERSKMREDVAAEIDKDPVYAAFKVLTEGELDGLPVKLSKEALTDAGFTPEDLKALPRNGGKWVYAREGGMDAEAAAEILGFDSGRQLIEALKGMEPRKSAIERIADERMKAKHGDMMLDGTIADNAVEALHNEHRAEVLATELRALRKKAAEVRPAVELAKKQAKDEAKAAAKDRAALSEAQAQEAKFQATEQDFQRRAYLESVPPIAVFREAAKELVDGTSVRDLQPNKYLIAQRQKAREAFELMSKDDYQGAADAKQKELLNHHLYLEATKAKEEAQKIADYGMKGETPKFQGRLGKAGADFQEQWNTLASRYEFSRVSNKALDERTQGLEAWAASKESEGIAIDPALFAEGHVKNWREVPISELRAVYDGLKNIETVARRSRQVLDGIKRVDFDQAVTELLDTAYGNLKSKPLPLDPEARSRSEKAASVAKSLNTGIVKLERVIDHLDGGDINGAYRRYVFDPIAEAQFKEYELNQKTTAHLAEALEKMPKEQRKHLTDIHDIPGIGKVTKKFILSAALNWGNASNREKMLKGMGWANNQEGVARMFEKMNRADWEFVQHTWDALETLWPEIAALQKRMTGLEPPKIDRAPFRANLADGTTMDLDGGYYPVVYDRQKSSQGAMQADTDIMNSEGGFNGPLTFKGHTKERVNFAAPLKMDFESVLMRHTSQVIKDLSHREAAQSVAKIIKNQNVRQAISETMGPEYEQMLMPWLKGTVNDVDGQIGADLSGWKSAMMTTRSNMVIAGLAFRPASVLVQATDFGRALTMVKSRHLGAGLLEFANHPIETTRMVRELSSEMRGRSENLDRDVRAMLKRTTGKDGFKATTTKLGMEGLAIADTITSVSTWLGAFKQASAEGKEQAQAVREADRAVRLTMMSSAPKDLVAIQRTGDVGMKLMTMYMGDTTSTYGIMNKGVRDIAAGKNMGKSLFTMTLIGMMLPLLGDLIKNRGPKDDEDKVWWATKGALMNAPSSIPILRDISQALQSGQDYKFSPVAGAIDKAVKTARMGAKLADPDSSVEWDDFFVHGLDSVGTLAGIPGTSQAKTTLGYVHDVQTGKRPEPDSNWEYTRNLIFGPPPKGKR